MLGIIEITAKWRFDIWEVTGFMNEWYFYSLRVKRLFAYK